MKKLTINLLLGMVLAFSFILGPAQPALAISFDEFFTIDYAASFSKTEVAAAETFTITIVGTASCSKDLEPPYNVITAALITGRIVARGVSTGTAIVLNPSYQMSLSPIPTKAGESVQDSLTLSLAFPAGTPPDTYQISGELSEANVKAIVWLDVTSMLPSSKQVGTVKIPGPIASGGGIAPGGGGIPGGAVIIVDNITDNNSFGISTDAVNLLTITLNNYLNEDGSVINELYMISDNADCGIVIPEGTIIDLPSGNHPTLTIETISGENLTTPEPQTYQLLGQAYRFGPPGTTFDPPLQLSFTFSPDQIPPGGTAANLRIAVWNEGTRAWEELESSVNVTSSTVTVLLPHFSVYSLIARVAPAEFMVSEMSIASHEITTGEKVRVSATVTNVGDLAGSHTLRFLHNGNEVNTEEIELAGQSSRQVDYYVTINVTGTHILSIDGLSTSIKVTDPIIDEPVPAVEEEKPDIIVAKPSPAEFSVDGLVLDRLTIRSGETLTVKITLSNTGDETGTHNLMFMVDGMVEDIRVITLAPGEKREVIFSTIGSAKGDHEITIGNLSASFSVKPTIDMMKYLYYGGGTVMVIVAATIVAVILKKRKLRIL